MNLKKTAVLALAVLTAGGAFAGGNKEAAGSASGAASIIVMSREDGSGTRGAFVELFGLLESNVDTTTQSAEISNSTAVMMTSVAGDRNSIGYISLGSLNDTVKAVSIDGVPATAANAGNGSYKIIRPFNIVTKGEPDAASGDFINYIMSREGQDVIVANSYISKGNSGPFTSSRPSGKIVVAGSSSVSPVMEKLIEAYGKINAGLTIELQTSDSSTGMNSTVDGVCQIGMASRDLRSSELEKGLIPIVIAMDGIAVIVNKANPVSNMTREQVKAIFTGQAATWNAIQ
jgi:phosphate transport system substrate-binding protein